MELCEAVVVAQRIDQCGLHLRGRDHDCSFELVQKTVTAGIDALVTVSAPTALALDLARKSNLFLAALGPGGPVVFNS